MLRNVVGCFCVVLFWSNVASAQNEQQQWYYGDSGFAPTEYADWQWVDPTGVTHSVRFRYYESDVAGSIAELLGGVGNVNVVSNVSGFMTFEFVGQWAGVNVEPATVTYESAGGPSGFNVVQDGAGTYTPPDKSLDDVVAKLADVVTKLNGVQDRVAQCAFIGQAAVIALAMLWACQVWRLLVLAKNQSRFWQ